MENEGSWVLTMVEEDEEDGRRSVREEKVVLVDRSLKDRGLVLLRQADPPLVLAIFEWEGMSGEISCKWQMKWEQFLEARCEWRER